jgi:hypothetical protein
MIVDVLEGRARWCVELGDCLDVLRSIPDASVDALVCDPPSGIAFMGSHWDTDKGGRDHWVAWLADRMREAFRVMKPGAHGAVWALPRTSHWAAYALENAGFEICDRKAHIFGSGFPKSVNVVESAIAAGRPYPNANPEAYELAEWMRANRAGGSFASRDATRSCAPYESTEPGRSTSTHAAFRTRRKPTSTRMRRASRRSKRAAGRWTALGKTRAICRGRAM